MPPLPLSVPPATLVSFPLVRECVMRNFRVLWLLDGREVRSGVAYDEPSAEARRVALEGEAGVSEVRVVEVKPGE